MSQKRLYFSLGSGKLNADRLSLSCLCMRFCSRIIHPCRAELPLCVRELVGLSEPAYYVRGNESGGLGERICILSRLIMCAGARVAGSAGIFA